MINDNIIVYNGLSAGYNGIKWLVEYFIYMLNEMKMNWMNLIFVEDTTTVGFG